jgi:hypothetical protein
MKVKLSTRLREKSIKAKAEMKVEVRRMNDEGEGSVEYRTTEN